MVTYYSSNPMTVTNYWPSNCAGSNSTAEDANSTYCPIIPIGNLDGKILRPGGGPYYRYVQSFGHT